MHSLYQVCSQWQHRGQVHPDALGAVHDPSPRYKQASLVLCSTLVRASVYNKYSAVIGIGQEAVSWMLLVALVWQFCLASFRDPGIVKRNSNELETNTADNSKVEVNLDEVAENLETGVETDRKHIPRILTERYCDTCCAKRPPLASHCRQCNNCVRRFDQ
jgi:hypothetical protein